MIDEVQRAHDAAVDQGELTYQDPQTGYTVFTELGLKARGRCCGCGCRHCPFQHERVPADQRAQKIRNPAWLTQENLAAEVVLFWSGGKDSFLALRALQRRYDAQHVALITTFDAESRVVAHQEIPVAEIIEQAQQLGVSLIGVPLTSDVEYVMQVTRALDLVPAVRKLAFGDLHLQHIREWREQAFASSGLLLEFPVWQVPYEALLADFERSGARSVVTAVTQPQLEDRIGQEFSADFVANLPDGVDAFGENGEFHTRVHPGKQV